MWVVGDSFVHWTSRVASSSTCGADLTQMATVRWLGRRGLRIQHFNDFLHSCWAQLQESPSCIIIHIGSNDLGLSPKKSMYENMKQILSVTRELLPYSIIFWSEILPRVTYPSALKQNSVERARRAINRSIGNLFRGSPGGLITHPQIEWWRQDQFLHDGIHLVDEALLLILHNYQGALLSISALIL